MQENPAAVKPRSRNRLLVVLGVVAAVSAFLFLRPREPAYQGKRLSAWLGDLSWEPQSAAERSEEESATRIMNQRQSAATNALLNIGAKAAPRLVQMIRSTPRLESLSDFLQKLVDKQDWVSIRIPQRRDDSWLAVAGFEVIGSNAAPAVPALAALLVQPHTRSKAGYSLAAIGSAAVPALTNALNHPDVGVRGEALLALGDIGPLATAALPVVLPMALDATNPLRSLPLSCLADLGMPAVELVPILEPRLQDTNTASAAVFALQRLGEAGRPALLRGLTNADTAVWIPTLAAIEFDSVERRWQMATGAGRYPFRHAEGGQRVRENLINLKWRYAASTLAPSSAWLARELAPLLEDNFEIADPGVKVWMAERLSVCGVWAVVAIPALKAALADSDAAVRRAADEALRKLDLDVELGAVVRGPRAERRIALVLTGHEFAEGAETILDELAKRHAKASFFLTGDFLATREFEPLTRRIVEEGHYLGPHSDKHLLYCAWEPSRKTLVTREQFEGDLLENVAHIQRFRADNAQIRYFLPPFEHYNEQIAAWTRERIRFLINFTPGTRSNADYTEDGATNFVSSQAIFDSIVRREREDPHGLNGYLLLFHLGAGPKRTDKFHARFSELLDYLSLKGYQFVRVDELLEGK